MQHIFLTLSNRAVYRNFFFFPKSFFYTLCKTAKDKNFKVIVLVEAKDVPKYREQIKSEIGLHCDIEGVEVTIPVTRLGKLFYFFYSYLIYTDTTKLLATFGTRPDEPPAGGKRYLQPLKWLISRTFGLIPPIKTKLVPWLFIRIYSDKRPFQTLFKKYSPKLIFTSHLYGWFDQTLLAEAKRQKVKTLGMAANWDHLDKYFLPLHVDTFVAQSNERIDPAMRYQNYSRDSVVISGYPHFDFITERSYVISRADVLKSLSLPPDAKFILYASGSTYCPDEPEVIGEIIKWIEAGVFGSNVYLLVRPYLGGRGKDREFDEEKFNTFEQHPRVRFYRKDFWADLNFGIEFMNILRQADVVVAIFTTMALEAVVLDRPVVAVGFDGFRIRPFRRSVRRFELFVHFQQVRKTGAMQTARTFPELQNMIKENIDNPTLKAKERAVMREFIAGPLDGKASERITKVITDNL